MKIDLVSGLLSANDLLACHNKEMFQANGVYVVNMMGAPGSGKTTLLEKTIVNFKDRMKIGVIEGDLYTTQDAERIGKLGVPVVQINTQGACHLDAAMIGKACTKMPLQELDVLFIENVGNLVCPAEFYLGEDLKVMVLGVTEGNDKPWKYPLMFREAKVIIMNKTDLIQYTDFDIKQFADDVPHINPEAKLFYLSAKSGAGVDEWGMWLYNAVKGRR